MKKIIPAIILALACAGCSGGLSTRLVEVEMRVALPFMGSEPGVPVFYPGGRIGAHEEQLVQTFGPSWRGLEADYPAYNFNP